MRESNGTEATTIKTRWNALERELKERPFRRNSRGGSQSIGGLNSRRCSHPNGALTWRLPIRRMCVRKNIGQTKPEYRNLTGKLFRCRSRRVLTYLRATSTPAPCNCWLHGRNCTPGICVLQQLAGCRLLGQSCQRIPAQQRACLRGIIYSRAPYERQFSPQTSTPSSPSSGRAQTEDGRGDALSSRCGMSSIKALGDASLRRELIRTRDALLTAGSEPGRSGTKYVGDKWGGKYLRAPNIYHHILEERRRTSWFASADVAEVRFGLKTGANDFFYLKQERKSTNGVLSRSSCGR